MKSRVRARAGNAVRRWFWPGLVLAGLAALSTRGTEPSGGLPDESTAEAGGSQATPAEEEDAEEPPQSLSRAATRTSVFRVPMEGTIDLGLAPFVSRVVEEAGEARDAVVLLDIDTFGGRVDAAVLIRDALIDAPVRTVAFIHPRAISAGALIALACEDIVMAPGGSIGAATPVTGGGMEETRAADEKFLSYMRTEMRATAEKRGRRGDVAEAMVDLDVAIEGVVEKGKLLTLSTGDALGLGIADYEASHLEDALEVLGLSGARVEARELNWAEVLARAVSEPTLSSLLLSIGFLGIMIELYQPGWGIPGSIGAFSLVTFFFGHHVARLAGWEELLLFALGAALLLLELLVIPGFGVAGAGGIALILVSVLLSLLALDFRVSWDLGLVDRALVVMSTSVIVTTVVGFAVVRLLPATGATRLLVLAKVLRSKEGFSSHDRAGEESSPLGSTGEAVTDLRPAGKIRIGAKRLDAVSEGDFIASGAPVTIVGWRSGTPVVRSRPKDENP